MILFWQFTLRTLEELDIVSNQSLSIEMFLIRLMHLKSFKNQDDLIKSENKIEFFEKNEEKKISSTSLKNDTVNQIKNVSQEKKIKLEIDQEVKAGKKILIDSFDQLLNTCNIKKEIKLKYELEKNVNLVNFENKSE